MKKMTSITLALVLVLSLGACKSDDATGDTTTEILSGNVDGEIGKTYRTKWFDFSVDALKTANEYEGGTAPVSDTYLIATVTETNTWSEDDILYMGTYDFYLDLDGNEVNAQYAWSETMMPEEFALGADESVTYDLVFVVPVETREIKFMHIEVDTEGGNHATFTIKHSL